MENSKFIMERSRRIFPGGVNSPIRAFRTVGGNPIVFERGDGKYLVDVDGRRYIDFCSSWGPLILGHCHPKVVEAITHQAQRALTFGAPSALELALAEKICSFVPHLQLLRFVSSGTEATMSALRVARAATGRNLCLKFEGCYHGHADPFLVKAGSGLASYAESSSAGVPVGAIQDTVTLPYADSKALQQFFEARGSELGALIIEPVAANMGLVVPDAGYLHLIRELTKKYGVVLIFDEVITGFRVAKGGCGERFGIEPDLWTFGKVIGGGLPAAAYGGRRDLMEHLAPLGKVYQAGTLSGNPLAMSAGLATLEVIEQEGVLEQLEAKGQYLDGLVADVLAAPLREGKFSYVRFGSIFSFFYGVNKPPRNFTEVASTEMPTFVKVFHNWIQHGIYVGPCGYEVGFLSLKIEPEDLELLVQSLAKIFSVTSAGL